MTQIVVPAEKLRAGLSPVSHFTKTPLSGSQVVLHPNADGLAIYASTYSAACETTVPCEVVGDEGPIIVDYDKLSRLVERESGDITITLEPTKLHLKGKTITATLQATQGDYLRRPSGFMHIGKVSPSHLRAAIQAVDHAADPPKSARESFRTVAFELTPDLTFRLSATDGLIAALHEIEEVQPALENYEHTWLVPVDLAKSLIPILGMRVEPVMIGAGSNDTTLHVCDEFFHWETALFAANPVNVNGIRQQWEDLPTHWVTVDRAEFLSAVRAAALFEIKTENDRYAKVSVACDKQTRTIGVAAGSSAGEATITVSGDFDDSFTFLATADHLIRAANAYNADELLIRVTRELRGILVGPADAVTNVHLVSPIKA